VESQKLKVEEQAKIKSPMLKVEEEGFK